MTTTTHEDGTTPSPILLDRGTRGDEGHFVTIHGSVVFIPDDHGTGANGKGGSFTKHGLEKKIVAHHESRGGGDLHDHKAALAEGSGGDLLGPSARTFHKQLPGEVKRHIENNPAARATFRVTDDARKAGGADALASMGDKYFQMVDDHAAGTMTAAIDTARKSDDPEARFHAAVYSELPKGKKQAQGIVKADKLREGHTFTVNGRKLTVKDGGADGLVLDGGSGFPETPVASLSEVPIDKYSLKMKGRDASREVAPFSREADDANIVYLSIDTEMKPAVTIGQGFPSVYNELPVHYRDVQATVCGKYTHPVTGQKVSIDPARVRRLAKNITTMLSRRVDVPVSKTHKYLNPDNTLGSVVAAREKDDELVLTVGYYGDDSLNVARKNKVSLGLCTDYHDSLGNVYDDTINHLAVTPAPVLHGLPGFVTLSRGEPTEANPPTLAPPNPKGVDMLDPALKDRVTQYLGDAAIPEDSNEVIPLLLAKLDAAPKPEAVTALSTELESTKAKVIELSREDDDVRVDPRIASLTYKAHKAEVGAMVADGTISKASGDVLLSLVESEKGKPNVTLLSRDEDDATIGFERVLKVVRELRAGKAPGELTGGQSVLLSREVPDGTPKEEEVTPERYKELMAASGMSV